MMASPVGIPSLSGGDLSVAGITANLPSASVPGMADLGSLAGSMMPSIPGLSSVPGMGSVPGNSLSSLMGMLGMVNLLNMLPNIASMLDPQQLLSTLTNVAALATMITQFPQFASQFFNGIYQGLMGLGTALVQAVTQPFGNIANAGQQAAGTAQQLANGISGAQGAVAGSQPYSPSGQPSSPSSNLPPSADGDLSVAEKNAKWGQNGRLDVSAGQLVKVEGVYLQPVMAEKYLALKEGAKAAGYDIYLTDGYRSYQGQVNAKAKWTARGKPGNAATPGTSNHGWGMAFDIGDNNGGAGQRWAQDNMTQYGLRNFRGGTSAVYGDEQWHFQEPGL